MPFSFCTGGGAAPRRPCVCGMREGAGGAAAFSSPCARRTALGRGLRPLLIPLPLARPVPFPPAVAAVVWDNAGGCGGRCGPCGSPTDPAAMEGSPYQ